MKTKRKPKGLIVRKIVGFSKEEALRELDKTLGELANNKPLPPDEMLFEDFAERKYLNWSKMNKRSWQRDEQLIRDLKPYFSGKTLTAIANEPELIERFKTERAQKVSKPTVNRALACLQGIFTRARRMGYYRGDNPVKDTLFKNVDKTIVRYLKKEEVLELLKQCASNKHLLNVVLVALNTGMRSGEIMKLKWINVNLNEQFIKVEYSKSKDRFIPINEQLEEVFKDLKLDRDENEPLVFHNSGKPIWYITQCFKSACKRAGISKDFRFHDLRHTFASQLVMAGVPLNTVRELLGHSSMQTTLRYAHLSPEIKTKAVSILKNRYPELKRVDGSCLGAVMGNIDNNSEETKEKVLRREK